MFQLYTSVLIDRFSTGQANQGWCPSITVSSLHKVLSHLSSQVEGLLDSRSAEDLHSRSVLNPHLLVLRWKFSPLFLFCGPSPATLSSYLPLVSVFSLLPSRPTLSWQVYLPTLLSDTEVEASFSLCFCFRVGWMEGRKEGRAWERRKEPLSAWVRNSEGRNYSENTEINSAKYNPATKGCVAKLPSQPSL